MSKIFNFLVNKRNNRFIGALQYIGLMTSKMNCPLSSRQANKQIFVCHV